MMQQDKSFTRHSVCATWSPNYFKNERIGLFWCAIKPQKNHLLGIALLTLERFYISSQCVLCHHFGSLLWSLLTQKHLSEPMPMCVSLRTCVPAFLQFTPCNQKYFLYFYSIFCIHKNILVHNIVEQQSTPHIDNNSIRGTNYEKGVVENELTNGALQSYTQF